MNTSFPPIYVFGNPDLPDDSLPLRLLLDLQKKFPKRQFIVQDPNEDWDVPDEIIVIDTVIGLTKPHLFPNLDEFLPAPRLTMHDFDALTNLRYLQKLGKLQKITILALPPHTSPASALDFIISNLNNMKPIP